MNGFGGPLSAELYQSVPHLPQYGVPLPSITAVNEDATHECNPWTTPGKPPSSRGVRPALSARISPISFSVRILNDRSRAVAMGFLVGSNNACMLRETRQR